MNGIFQQAWRMGRRATLRRNQPIFHDTTDTTDARTDKTHAIDPDVAALHKVARPHLMARPALALSLALAAGPALAQTKGAAMDESLFQTRPVCIGRYVLDLPRALDLAPIESDFSGFKIRNLGAAQKAGLDARISDRIALMKRGGTVDDISGVTFLSAEAKDGVTFLAYDEAFPPGWNYAPAFFHVELYFLSGGDMFSVKGMVAKADRAGTYATLLRLAQSIRPRAPQDVPDGEGACIDGGFVAGPRLFARETIGAAMGNESRDRLVITFDSEEGPKAGEKGHNWPADARKRTIAGIPGTMARARGDTGDYKTTGYLYEFYGFAPPGGGSGGASLQIRMERNAPTDQPPFTFAVGERIWAAILASARRKS